MPRLFLLSVNVTTEKLRIQMLGFRGSAEVVGSLIPNLSSRAIVSLGWTATFLAYAGMLCFGALFFYLVPC